MLLGAFIHEFNGALYFSRKELLKMWDALLHSSIILHQLASRQEVTMQVSIAK